MRLGLLVRKGLPALQVHPVPRVLQVLPDLLVRKGLSEKPDLSVRRGLPALQVLPVRKGLQV